MEVQSFTHSINILLTVHFPFRSILFLYADPGSGMLLWQLIAGVLFSVMYYFRKTIFFISKKAGAWMNKSDDSQKTKK